jgi:molybdenum cofactor synthesis domain-containing protein
VLTVSDSVATGARTDRSGPDAEEKLFAMGFDVVARAAVPDDRKQIAEQLNDWIEGGVAELIVTTGGTGLGPRDVTPEAVGDVIDREIPGYGEHLRADGLRYTPLSVLSRSRAGAAGKTLILALPGNPRAVVQGLDAVRPNLSHALDLLAGKTQHQ